MRRVVVLCSVLLALLLAIGALVRAEEQRLATHRRLRYLLETISLYRN